MKKSETYSHYCEGNQRHWNMRSVMAVKLFVSDLIWGFMGEKDRAKMDVASYRLRTAELLRDMREKDPVRVSELLGGYSGRLDWRKVIS